MSEYLNWHDSDPRKIRFIRCLMRGDNGIQLILWWIKIGNKNWVKCLVVDYCIITVDIFANYRDQDVHFPASGCSQLFIFPRDQFSLCTALHKSREINFVKTWRTNVTQWMALCLIWGHSPGISPEIRDRGTRNAGVMAFCNQFDAETDQGMFSSFWPPLRLSEHNKAIITRS